MKNNEARDKILSYLRRKFEKGIRTSNNLDIYMGLKKKVSFTQINKVLEELEKEGVIK